jgi:hypothetical protein
MIMIRCFDRIAGYKDETQLLPGTPVKAFLPVRSLTIEYFIMRPPARQRTALPDRKAGSDGV